MKNINEIIADVAEPPKTFEGYLMAYADQGGDLVNTYLPAGTHPDMDRYLYAPLKCIAKTAASAIARSSASPHAWP